MVEIIGEGLNINPGLSPGSSLDIPSSSSGLITSALQKENIFDSVSNSYTAVPLEVGDIDISSTEKVSKKPADQVAENLSEPGETDDGITTNIETEITPPSVQDEVGERMSELRQELVQLTKQKFPNIEIQFPKHERTQNHYGGSNPPNLEPYRDGNDLALTLVELAIPMPPPSEQ